MRRGILALEGIKQPPAFDGVFAGHGRRSGSFAGPRDGKDVWNVQPECRRITVRRTICERTTPCREQQVSAIFADQRVTYARYRAVLFIYEQARISVGEGDVAGGGHRRGQLDDNHEWVLIVALEGQRLAVGSFLLFSD